MVNRVLTFTQYKPCMFNFIQGLLMITMIFSDFYEVRSGKTLWFARSMTEAVIILHLEESKHSSQQVTPQQAGQEKYN